MAAYKVSPATQVSVDGVVYLGGETVALNDDTLAAEWLKAGYITEVEPAPAPAKPKAPAKKA